MKQIFFVLFFFVFDKSLTKYLSGNFGFLVTKQNSQIQNLYPSLFTPTSNVSNILTCLTVMRGRFGYQYFGVSTSNTSLNGDIIFAFTNQNNQDFSYHHYYGTSNSTLVNPLNIFNGTDTFMISSIDTNEYPIGPLVNSMYGTVFLNKTYLLNKYNTSFYVYMGFSYSQKPSGNPITFDPIPSESTFFQYTLENIDPSNLLFKY